MVTKSDRLAILSDAEQFALYGLPDFDDGQRLEYLCSTGCCTMSPTFASKNTTPTPLALPIMCSP